MRPRPPTTRNLLRVLGASALALSVTACTVLPELQPPPQLFILTPKSTFRADLPKVGWQLTVKIPFAEAGLNTTRIALRRSAVSLDYFDRASWIDTAPRMVQTLLVESFDNTRRIVAVGRQSVSLRTDYTLISDLREFQAEYGDGNSPFVHVRINAKLVKMPQRNIIATLIAEHVVRAEQNNLEAVVKAFDSALGKVLKRIVEWVLTTAPVKRRG